MFIPLLFAYFSTVDGFNLSPDANYVFHHPVLKTFIQPARSSYFGFSVNLRTSGILVGAPRAQSDLEYQRNINETGAIYKCNFNNPTDGCVPYRLDRQGNTNYEEYYSDHPEIQSELKEHQMLGATVEGLGSDSAYFVACAPQLKGNIEILYLLHGVCYVTEGVQTPEEPNHLFKIKPLRMKGHQRTNGKDYKYIYGEQGFSLHVTDDGSEILIGAPGVMDWRGTVIRYRRQSTSASTSRNNVYIEYSRRRGIYHESVVPNPVHTNIPINSYFGYAISSGQFLGTRKRLYVASAPQARSQHGEVIIFDYTDNRTLHEMVIDRYRTFVGQQFGEYFGYSLLTEDFNNDGLPDLAIGAPMHSRTREYDNGAVYVHLNSGELNFELQSKLMSAYEFGGRFGTSLGKIGDLNRDGYGDIAIGAPFEDDGVVYIFLGSSNGVRSRPSQRLLPSFAQRPTKQPYMFGHALSRGVDIDGNGYPDLAVGAPNGETVQVFRSYPIVRIEARINSTKRELPAERSMFEMDVCMSAEYPAGVPFPVALQYTLEVDSQIGRALIANRITPAMPHENVTIDGELTCVGYSIAVNASLSTLNQPLVIELEFSMAPTATPPKGGSFCNHCAILHPEDSNRVQERIPFKTGCRKEVCESDLKITNIRWGDVVPPFVMGSAKKVTLEVDIENAGENAYLPQLNLTTPSVLRLINPSQECTQTLTARGQNNIVCDLNNGLPLKSLSRVKHSVTFDVSQLEGGTTFLDLGIQAVTTSKELWPRDNVIEERLLLKELSYIDIVSKTSPREANLETQKDYLNVSQLVKLHNNGPSTLYAALFLADIPLSYTPPHMGAQKRCQIVQPGDITVRSSYNDTGLEVNWIQPSNENDVPTQTFAFYLKRQSEQYAPQQSDDTPSSSKLSMPHNVEVFDQDDDLLNAYGLARIKQPGSRQKRSNLWLQPTQQSSASAQLDELPSLRTVHFNCAQNRSAVECLQLQIELPPFTVSLKPIYVELQYRLNLKAIEACLQEQENIFVVQVLSDLVKPSDELKETYRIARNNPYTVINRNVSVRPPFWIYVTSSFGGLLLLAIITYTMNRIGFFKRHIRQEMYNIKDESGILDSKTDIEDSTHEVSEI